MTDIIYDVIIAGGGVAGLSAALILGRCRQDVLVCDSGRPRNAASQALHGFLSRDGIKPAELRSIARQQLSAYPSVRYAESEIVDAVELPDGYRVDLADGRTFVSRYLLVATGVVDRLPPLKNIEEYYGHNVFHCPYCDGWEMRDQPIAVYGAGADGAEYALELLVWSSDVVLCTDTGEPPPDKLRQQLDALGIGIYTNQFVGLEGEVGGIIRLLFADGSTLARRAVFFSPLQYQASPLAEKLGCHVTDGGVVKAGKLQQTRPRLFVAGDAARSIQLAVIAAAEGAEAAFALNTILAKEKLHARLNRP